MAKNKWELGLSDFQAMQEKKEVTGVLALNRQTEQYGLTLTEGEVRELVVSKKETLKREMRMELGKEF